MISDVLSDAAAELERYITDSAFDGAYGPELRERVRALQAEMAAIVAELDRPPSSANPR